jgi:hypothetical protein
VNSINREKLLSGAVFGDPDKGEYIYLPGGEIGSDRPLCVLEQTDKKRDVSLEDAAAAIDRLQLRQLPLLPFGRI